MTPALRPCSKRLLCSQNRFQLDFRLLATVRVTLSMKKPSPSVQQEIEELIAATYSPNRPDPYGPVESIEERLDHFCHDTDSSANQVYVIYEVSEPDYSWNPENAEWLEDYVSEERLEELSQNALPTEQEMEWYRSVADSWLEDNYWKDEVAYVYRLKAPEGSSETRVVFFVWNGLVEGQQSATHGCAGPLKDADEVSAYLNTVIKKDCESDILEPFPEQEAFGGPPYVPPAPEQKD
jgi:hypothetical protein